MNEFFRCPKQSGTTILIMIISILVYIVGYDNIISKGITSIGGVILFIWALWSLYNIIQDPKCYAGFRNSSGLSYLNPFSGLF